MNKTCLLSGNFALDTIIKYEYPDGFNVGKNNRHIETLVTECVGNTCGNVSSILPYLGVQTFPIAHFDLSEQGIKMKNDLQRYGADVRFVEQSIHGGTTLLQCIHKRKKETGEHIISFRATSPGSRFLKRRFLRLRDEAPAFLQKLDFTPDIFFFDASAAGLRYLASELRQRGTLIYFEPETDDDKKNFDKALAVSDIIKFSNEKISDISFVNDYTDKLFIRTLGAEGLEFNLRNQGWQKVEAVKNDNVVDWEGAGDWITSQLIASLCEKDILSIGKMTNDNIRECLVKASEIASRSISFLSSKGLIDAEKGWDKPTKKESNIKYTAPTIGIMGAICGDAIGSEYEQSFKRTKDFNFKLLPEGSRFTDDTVMTLAIAKWLLGERTTDKLIATMVDIGRRYPGAGYGSKFRKWLRSDIQQPYGAASNGSAMRVSAVGWACQTLEDTLALAKQTADVSHSAIQGEYGAMSVAAAIFLARTGHSKPEIKKYIEHTFGYDLSRTVEEIRLDYQFEPLCEKSVPEAIICWLQSSTYEETVRNAVSLGGDADTQAAIAGAIAAATPGMEIPQHIADACFALLTDELKTILINWYEFLKQK